MPATAASKPRIAVIGGKAARGSISGSIESATECVECMCTMARAALRV